MQKPADLRALQTSFADHLRDPAHAPAPPDVEDRRMAVYRRLVFSNVATHLADAFPVLRSVTPDDRWHALVRDYLAVHRARTPYFPRMPLELLAYLEGERDAPDDPPWMLELAHYEWTGRAVAIDPREIDRTGVDPEGDLLQDVPVANPVVALLTYAWPVHRIAPGQVPEAPPSTPTHLVVYRDTRDHVGHVETNAVGARLLDLIREAPAPGLVLLERIAQELGHPDPQRVVEGGRALMEGLREREILLGTRPAERGTTPASRS